MTEDEGAIRAAQSYTRQHIGGMQPVETIGEKVFNAFIAGVEYGRQSAVAHEEKR